MKWITLVPDLAIVILILTVGFISFVQFRRRNWALACPIAVVNIAVLAAFLWLVAVRGDIEAEAHDAPIATFFGVVGFIATIFALVAGLYGFSYYMKRPRLEIGVVPIKCAHDYLESALYDEVRFKEEKAARRFYEPLLKKRLHAALSDEKRMAITERDDTGETKIFVVFLNYGIRMVDNYSLSITFDNSKTSDDTIGEIIDIIDIESENVYLDGFFTCHPDLVRGKQLQEFESALESVRVFYSQAVELGLPESQPYALFRDSLPSYEVETICFTLKIPRDVKQFDIFYRWNCPGIFAERQLYAQRVKVLPDVCRHNHNSLVCV